MEETNEPTDPNDDLDDGEPETAPPPAQRARRSRNEGRGADFEPPQAQPDPVRVLNEERERKFKDRAAGKKSVGWTEKDAHLLWGEILDYCKAKGFGAHQVRCYVARFGSEGDVDLGGFACDAASGGAHEFFTYFVNTYHRGCNHFARYRCRFHWIASSSVLAIGEMRLPSYEELLAMQPQAAKGRTQPMNAPAYGEPSYGAPPAMPSYGTGAPAPAYGAPQGAGRDDGVALQLANLRVELQGQFQSQMKDTLVAVFERLGLSRPGAEPAAAAPAAAGVGAPTTVQFSTDAVADAILRKLGHAQPASQAPIPPPPAPPERRPSQALRELAKELSEGLQAVQEMRNVGTLIEQHFGAGVGAPVEVVAEPIAEPKPEDGLPWTNIPIPGVVIDGDQVVYAKKKTVMNEAGEVLDSGGGLDLMGTIMSNPILGKTIAGVASKIGDSVTRGIERAIKDGMKPSAARGVGGVAEPVDEIPHDARPADGTASSSGWPEV